MKKNLLLYLFIIAIGASVVLSCKKDETPVYSPVGFWKGQWSNTSPATPPNLNYLWILFRSDGTLRQYYDDTDTTGMNKNHGTWTKLNDSTVSWTNLWGEYYIGVFRNSGTQLVGTWGDVPAANNEGQFYVNKQ